MRKTKEFICRVKEKYINLNHLQVKWELRRFIVKYSKLKARKIDKQNKKLSSDPSKKKTLQEIKEKKTQMF